MKKNAFIYGIRAVMEALKAEESIDRIYIQKGLKGDLVRELQDLIRKKGVQASVVPVERLNKFTHRNHQGVVASISAITYRKDQELIEEVLQREASPLFLLLDGISDVRNLGAILRTAACTGVHGVFLPASGSAPITADTVKTSAGAALTMPVARCLHLKDVIYYLKASGVRVAAATEKAEQSLFETDLGGPIALVMGSEDTGVTPSLLKLCDITASLPMEGSIESLNVSVACGVFLYEILRQRSG